MYNLPGYTVPTKPKNRARLLRPRVGLPPPPMLNASSGTGHVAHFKSVHVGPRRVNGSSELKESRTPTSWGATSTWPQVYSKMAPGHASRRVRCGDKTGLHAREHHGSDVTRIARPSSLGRRREPITPNRRVRPRLRAPRRSAPTRSDPALPPSASPLDASR